MQFLPATFAHAAKLAGIADPDICDPADAIPAAAAYLRVQRRARATGTRALYRYNPADWYPPLVLRWAVRYGYGALGASGRSRARIYPALRPDRASPASRRSATRARCYAHFHDGIDIAAPIGTPVRAIAAGRVILAGRVSDGAVVVEIDHGAKVETRSTAISSPRSPCSKGDSVAAGQLLGTVGLTGNTTGPHLHFEL